MAFRPLTSFRDNLDNKRPFRKASHLSRALQAVGFKTKTQIAITNLIHDKVPIFKVVNKHMQTVFHNNSNKPISEHNLTAKICSPSQIKAKKDEFQMLRKLNRNLKTHTLNYRNK